MPSENYNSQFDRLSRIQETKDLEEAIGAAIATIQAQVKVPVALDKEWKHFEIQQICSETGGWEQITPINRFLRTASVTREKLLAATHQYLVLDSILRIKSKGSKASPVLDIKSENIRRTVEKALKNLDNNISDIECDLVLAERTVSTEKGGLVGIKNQLARIEQRLIAMTPNLQRLEHSPPLAPIEGTSKGDDAPGTSQEGPARLTEKEIDDDEYPALLCAETVKVQESTNTDKSIVMEPETSTGRKGPVMEKNNKTEPITAGTSSSSIKTKKKHLHVENTQDQAIQALEKDLDDLRFGFGYLSRRKLGEPLDGPPDGRCTFCDEYGHHFSDSCLRITEGEERWRFIKRNRLCQFCLSNCNPNRRCRNELKPCWYCSIVRPTILNFLIPLDGGQHRALCPVPDSRMKISERIQDMEQEIARAKKTPRQ